MARQTTIPGLERKVNERVAAAGEAHASAINSHTRASVKRRDTRLELIRIMREEKVDVYVDLEAKPPIRIDLTTEDKVKVTKWKGDEEEETKKAKSSSKKKKAAADDDAGADEETEPTEPQPDKAA